MTEQNVVPKRHSLHASAGVLALLVAIAFPAVVFAQPPSTPNRLPPVTEVEDIALIRPEPEPELTSPANADAKPDADPSKIIAELNKRLSKLEGDLRKKDEAEKKKKDEEKKVKEGWQDMSTDKWNVRLGGHVQLDYINWADKSPSIPGAPAPGVYPSGVAQDYFEFRRLRLLADGTGYGVYDFRLQVTLEPETVGETGPVTVAGPGTLSYNPVVSPDVKDAYFSINELPIFGRLRVGNFFVPYGLEQVTNDTNNIFLERSIPTQGVFCADREVGIASYNCTEDKNVSWSYGIFFDSVSESLKEKIDSNQGYRLSGRGVWLPYYDEVSNGRYLVHTGLGVLHTDDGDNNVRFRSRPQIKEGPRIIDSLALNADTFTSANAEFAVVWGNVTFQSEAYLCGINMNGAPAENIGGYYAHVSYFLTGENRIYERFGQHGAQFGRNAPFSNVFWVPGCASPGAWEFKCRYSNLNLDNLNRGQYNDITVGFNWYWSDRVRMMFDWIHPTTTGTAVFGATNSDILGTRFDFNW